MSQEEANATGRLLGAGEIVGGHYQVESVLGEGGMAVVYRARNMATDKVCAVKVLHAQLGARTEFQTLFSKEAKVGTRNTGPVLLLSDGRATMTLSSISVLNE